VMGADEELLLVSERGVIVRLQSAAIPQQSRAATGVRLQRIDKGDRLTEVVLVPPAAEEDDASVPADGAAEATADSEAAANATPTAQSDDAEA